MKIIHSENHSTIIRTKADQIHNRLWIASPFIGSWNQVRCLLGKKWLENGIDVRIITDEDNGRFLNEKTLRVLSYAGQVRTLRGLHAKLYILDNSVLLTSANLTGTAFSKRYEAGVFLTGATATPVIRLFDKWWKSSACHTINLEMIREIARKTPPRSEEPAIPKLPELWKMPRDPGDFYFDSDFRFFDYEYFLESYTDFCEKYSSIQRLWKRSPLYFEIDAFLNYLYHDHPLTPSERFGKRKAATLTEAQQFSRIKKYARQFARWLDSPDCMESPNNRIGQSKTIRKILNRNLKHDITKLEITEILNQLNCMTSVAIAKVMFLNNNSTKTIREAWRALINEKFPIQKRMIDCYNSLNHCGRSIIQELLGYYDPQNLPLRNQNANSGLRFFGYNVSRY